VPGVSSAEHPASSTSSTRHFAPEHPAFDVRAPGIHAGAGLEVKQVESNSGREKAGGEAKTAATTPIYLEKFQRLTSRLEDAFYNRAVQDVLSMRGPQKAFADVQFDDIEQRFLECVVNQQGIPMRDFRKAYNDAMRKVELVIANALRPSNLDPRPIDPAALKECAEQDGDCLQYFIEDDNAIMVFKDGSLMFISGELEPVWHPFDSEVLE